MMGGDPTEPVWAWYCEKCEDRSEAIYTRSHADRLGDEHDKEKH